MANANGADWSYFDRPATDVENNISTMNGRANEAIAQVHDVVASLGALQLPADPGAPTYNLPDIADFVPDAYAATPSSGAVGELSVYDNAAFDDLTDNLGLNLSDFDITIPTFVSTAGPITFPADPAAMDTSGKPDRPATNTDITIPDAPDIIMPDLGDLSVITIPEFTFPTLPLFNGTEPVFDGVAPNTDINWSEPIYVSENLTELTGRISAMLAGGTGMPIGIQQALFDAARAREGATALDAEQTAFDTYAGRNFSMPPGMLVKNVAQAIEKSRLASNSLEREILTKSAQWEIENVRVAVERGLGLETLLVNKFMNIAERAYQVSKFRLESEIKLYDVMVTLFNSRQTAFKVLAEVFKIKTDAALAELEVYKAQIEGARLLGQLNEQVVKVYIAKLDGVTKVIDVFKAKMEGAKVQADVVKAILEGYGFDVKAWGEKISAEKERFVAFYEQVRAVAEKAKTIEYEARAYEATVRGQEAGINGKAKYMEARIGALRASVDKYRAQIEQDTSETRSSLEAMQAKGLAFAADTHLYATKIQGVNLSREVTLKTLEARLTNSLKYFDVLMREYDSSNMRVIERVKVTASALEAASRATSQLAAGAMSAIHLQASVHGQASISDSYSYNSNHNFTGV